MQCERCNKKKSTVFYRESINGRVRALRLCADCAEFLEQAGELEDMSIALTGVLSPFFSAVDSAAGFPLGITAKPGQGGGRKCSFCGVSFDELAASGAIGCTRCYSAFAEELEPVLRAAHGENRHRGRCSSGFRARQEKMERLEELRVRLKKAVLSEEFEKAVELRDEIRALEAAL